MLAPGGRLVVYDCDRSTLSGRWVAFFEGRLRRHSVRFVTGVELERRVRAAGFQGARRESFGSGAFVVAER